MDDGKIVDGEAAAEPGAEKGETGAGDVQGKIAEAMAAEGEGGAGQETTPATEPGAEAQAEPDPELEDGKLQAGEVKGLSPEAQAKVNARIHELNVKRKQAEARAAELEAKTVGLEQRDAEAAREAIRLGLAPEYVSKEEVADLKRYEQLRMEKRWLTQHRDGYEGTGKDGDTELSAEQIADRQADVEDELSDLAPRMKALLRERSGQMLADMRVGRKIRMGSGANPTVRKPSALPGNGRTQPRGPVPRQTETQLSAKSFSERGGNKRALEDIYESRF
ncbi:MAG: hypothetical protein M0R06_08855 [Sphaerochaeta sp.]|nr:hypothetical protein [Sphaerochaeta sp.]